MFWIFGNCFGKCFGIPVSNFPQFTSIRGTTPPPLEKLRCIKKNNFELMQRMTSFAVISFDIIHEPRVT